MVRLYAALCGVFCNVGVSLRVGKTADQEMSMEMSASMVEAVSANFSHLADEMMNPKSPDGMLSLGSHLGKLAQHIDVASAIKAVEHKIPPAVAAMLQHRQGEDPVGPGGSRVQPVAGLNPESYDKARFALNELVEKAWIELDNKIMECKGFEEMNRDNYNQARRDLERLISQVTDLERLESEAIADIQSATAQIGELNNDMADATTAYNTQKAADDAELSIRENDLDVFAFILRFTKCEDATTLVQVCELKSGRKTLRFKDPTAAKEYAKLLQSNPQNRNRIDKFLRLAQTNHTEEPEPEWQALTTSERIQITVPVNPEEVIGVTDLPCTSGASDDDSCMKQCSPDGTPDCALLHDKLSLLWGQYKDKVDELTRDMETRQAEFLELKQNLNEQIANQVSKKTSMNQLLAETRGHMASDRSEAKSKQEHIRMLDSQYTKEMRKCKNDIEWILYQDMCAIKIVRDAVLIEATSCPTSSIVDCDVGAWVAGACTKTCDDDFDPHAEDLMAFGGWQPMTRPIVVNNNDCGIKCPALQHKKKCGQRKCPIDCELSAWSGWSSCTADCEGGVKSRTRSVLVKPDHGGLYCDTVEEEEPCNTESCDRDCTLAKWTKYTPCSVSCGGGTHERFRHVLVPTRGDGKCDLPESRKRYQFEACNTFQCNGDEVCVAKQDLVIAVDASGSVRDNGWNLMKDFVEKLIGKYENEYWGSEAVQIGVVQFGNGVLEEDGRTVSPAREIHPLTFDHEALLNSVNAMEFKKGFTNMAQAFSLADTLFTRSSRSEAQHSVMILTDGKPSFSFITEEEVKQLDSKAIMRYFFVITKDDSDSDTMELIKSWASQPWETNVIHVHGMDSFEADMDTWIEKSVTRFCPQAYSPTLEAYRANAHGYKKVKVNGQCGDWSDDTKLEKATPENVERACAQLAAENNAAAFYLKNKYGPGKPRCRWSELPEAEVKTEWENDWKTNARDPACTEGWKKRSGWEFFAIIPMGDDAEAGAAEQ